MTGVTARSRRCLAETLETDVGNGDPLHVGRAIFDDRGAFVGVAYRQSSDCEISVFVG